MYTGFFGSGKRGFVGNVGFSSTYSAKWRASFGVMLGCTDEDRDRIIPMLQCAGHAWNHPMLLPLVFLEIQTQRLAGLVEGIVDKAVEISEELRVLRRRKSDEQPTPLIDATLDLRQDNMIVLEDLAAASRQLKDAVSHCEKTLLDEQEARALGLAGGMDDARRILERLGELDLEYQDNIAKCRINVDEVINILSVVSGKAQQTRASVLQLTRVPSTALRRDRKTIGKGEHHSGVRRNGLPPRVGNSCK